MITFETLKAGQIFFFPIMKDVFFVKEKDPYGWLIRCWWATQPGKKSYYVLKDIHFDAVEWYETFKANKISEDFSQLPSSYKRKLFKAVI
jgi:hypothetical protein